MHTENSRAKGLPYRKDSRINVEDVLFGGKMTPCLKRCKGRRWVLENN